MKTLNEMKVASRLLGEGPLADIALELAAADHLFREGAVGRITRIVIEAAGMRDLYGDAVAGVAATDWMRAKVGEVWALEKTDGATGAYIFDGAAFIGELLPGGGNSIPLDSPQIISAERIWEPES